MKTGPLISSCHLSSGSFQNQGWNLQDEVHTWDLEKRGMVVSELQMLCNQQRKPDLVVSHDPQSQEHSSTQSYLSKDLTSSQEGKTGKDRALIYVVSPARGTVPYLPPA